LKPFSINKFLKSFGSPIPEKIKCPEFKSYLLISEIL